MPHVEAVACGLRVGYTNFGGPKSNLAGLDTCTEFGYELEPSFYHNHLGEPFYGFGENPQWARPNIEEVKAWMRAVYEEKIGSTKVNSKK